MRIDILTLFPEMFEGVLPAGVIGRAAVRGLLDFQLTNIRDHTTDKHRKTDDYPFGGGAGQLMSPQPIFDALRSLGLQPHGLDASGAREGEIPLDARLVYLSPRGRLLDKELAMELSLAKRLVLLCGHYEGVDQRALDAFRFEEISIGDYILTGGELASMVLIDTVCRLVPGVLGSEASHAEESIYSGLLEYPQYTRPAAFEGMDTPEILLSGDHKKIALWNFEEALKLTAQRRPELLRTWLEAHLDSLDKQRKRIAFSYLKSVEKERTASE